MNSSSQCFAFSFPFFTGTIDELARMCLAPIPERSGVRLVVTANVDHIVSLRENSQFRRAYQIAWQRTIDGAPLYLYLRLRGNRVQERVPGSDLFPVVIDGLQENQHRPFFICSKKETAARLTSHLVESKGFRESLVMAVVPPFGFESDSEYSRQLVDRIVAHGTTHLFLGVGAPKSEIWTYQHAQRLGDQYVFCFGAGLDYFVGTTKRAPRVLRKAGLEWVWRVASEPKRLIKRYFVRSWSFLGIAARDWTSGGKPFSVG